MQAFCDRMLDTWAEGSHGTRLLTWYREGKDVQRMLPLLSTYLGHCGVEETSVYLQMTRELLEEANHCFERYAFAEAHNG